MLQIIVFEMAILIGIAGHFSQTPFVRTSGWVLMAIFIIIGIAHGSDLPPFRMM